MVEQIEIARQYLDKQVPLLIEVIKEDSKPVWGSMTALEMLEHLIITLKFSQGKIDVATVTSPNQYDGIKAFLLSDQSFPKHAKFPITDEELGKWKIDSLSIAKVKLMEEIEVYLKFVKEQPEFLVNHPYAGPMSSNELVVFHKKHFTHHFTQFGLI
jgi:hypothetical protein